MSIQVSDLSERYQRQLLQKVIAQKSECKQAKPVTPTESDEQIMLFQWVACSLGKHPELKLLFHIPNGGHRSKAEAGRFYAEGVKAGVPDLCLPVARGKYHGLYIEMKRTKRSTVSKEQKDWISALQEQGYRVDMCKGWEVASQVLVDYPAGSPQETKGKGK